MGVFGFFSWALVTVLAVTLLWPLNVPVAALAYKVRLGPQPVPLESREFWIRSTFAALGLAVLGLVLLGLTYVLVEAAELPPGPTQLLLVACYLPAAVWFVFWIFALEDLLQALGVFMLYVLLAGLPLLLLGRLFGVWARLHAAAPWLWSTSERALLP